MIKSFHLEETGDTPEVTLDPENNVFKLSGRSLPENSADFYQPILEWIDTYSQSPNAKTQLEINIFYFNTSSSKMVMDIFFKMEDLKNAGHDVEIIWYCDDDDDDMVEMGEEFGELVEVPVTIKFNEA